jgi:putative nucleotidyltransferase with HDIG domain
LKASQAIRKQNDELFLTLAKIIDARDPYVSNHAAKVADYATAIARELKLSPDRIEHVRQAAFLHDIGKLAVPEAILHKPARLTPEEYDQVKTHVDVGAAFLESCHGLRHLAAPINCHHEWWDGHGYPRGLRGEKPPLEARILALSDAVEAMASDRPYHAAMPLDDIIAEVRRCSATQFDPKVVDAFVRVIQQSGAQLVVNSARAQVQVHTWNVAPRRATPLLPSALLHHG